MTDVSLLDHERAVERSRVKLADDLAVLCSADTFATFTDDLKQEALDSRDALWDELKAGRPPIRQPFWRSEWGWRGGLCNGHRLPPD